MFKKILIANRGEIAMRVIRACRELGIATVAVHSQADDGALHVRFADEAVCIGPAAAKQSYLNIPAIISAAEISGADAIHPGYGFLSENAEFAEIVERCGLTFIGPKARAMRAWGDKLLARENAIRYGLPLLTGSEALTSVAHAEREALRVGLPVMLKARGGGGGRGMRVIREVGEVGRAFESATAEAMNSFNNPELYLERFVERPRHIEFQALADEHGQVWTLGERECSLQRRHQKLVEESPSPMMTEELRSKMGELIRRAITESGYSSLGTLEFLMDERGELYFLEMNTRVQVEHPVTEMVTGVDLVEEQIRVAAGEKLPLPDTRPWRFRGHAIECRVMAEDPDSFVPWPGLITEYHPPGGAGVRVDSGVFGGWKVPSVYDSLLAKVIVHAPTRAEALVRMRRALDEFIIGGIRTNLPFQKRLMNDREMIDGTMTTRTVERVVRDAQAARPPRS
ncbi:MAG: acetyl-CoA carboxylase biotin carboxylase subunit [Sorangiineae bacterium]|nr:acetyl-CoA carboxylase biotin carboxylase subunit [Polyangiaceae bacterium]MEB2321264.1 acetyl-CoA carboxylase biotin carboxylase subunit [Sorangiineae bacterium]